MSRSWPLAVLAGLALAGLVLFTGMLSGKDLASRALTGMEAPDDGYWSAPLRRLAGAGRQDAYDERLALSLALPQNAVGAAATSVGVPYAAARFCGGVLAAFLLGVLAVRAWPGGGFLLPFLATAPVFAHLTSDLGEGPATAIAAAFAVAALRGRWVLAGACVGLGLFQKACGLFLGVGLLAGVMSGGADVARRFARAGAGVTAGVFAATAVAVAVFGDDATAFVLRPWTATQETGTVPGLGRLVSMVFPAHHGVGAAFALPFLVVALLARRMGPRPPAVVAAAIAGLAFSGAFPDPWRIVPVLPLFAFALHREPGESDPRTAAPGAWAFLLTLAVVPQAIGALAAQAGWRPGAWALTGMSLAGVGALSLPAAARLRVAPTVAGLAWLLALLVGTLGTWTALASRTSRRLDLATLVSRRLPQSAHLIAYSSVGARFEGTLWYPPFAALWQGELSAAAPATLHRLRATADEESPPPPPPPGYAVTSTEPLGLWPYGRDETERPLVLDTMRRR